MRRIDTELTQLIFGRVEAVSDLLPHLENTVQPRLPLGGRYRVGEGLNSRCDEIVMVLCSERGKSVFRTREIGSQRNKRSRLVNRCIGEYIHKFSIPVRSPTCSSKTVRTAQNASSLWRTPRDRESSLTLLHFQGLRARNFGWNCYTQK
jgi:hypothetical protein